MKKIKDIFNRIKGKEGNVKKIKIMLVVFGVVLLISAGAYASEVIVFGSERKGAVVAFTEVGEHTWTVPVGVTEIDVLIVGGGGSGASTFQEHKGGGGGAGGLVFRAEYSVIPGEEIIVKVGAGGDAIPDSEATGNRLPGITGEDSSFGDLVALGGGGGRRASSAGAQSGDGGSGGGGHYATAGGNALQPSSSTGGYGNPGGSRASASEGYGGGGAGTPGNNDGDSPADGRVQLGRWAGGQGLYEVVVGGTVYNFASIFGKDYGEYAEGEIWFAGGGGGGRNAAGDSTYGAGGYGGGGRGAYQNQGVSTEWGVGSSKGEDGKPNTGGGGGGARGGESGAGGSGIILIRYQPHLKGASIESGLVGHWRLDEAWYDSSTNRVTDSTPYENHGTNNGATFTTDRKGRDGGAMEFDGGSDYIMIASNAMNFVNEFEPRTISFHIKMNTMSGFQMLLGGINNIPDNSGYNGNIQIRDGNLQIIYGQTSNSNNINTDSRIDTNQWIHVAIVDLDFGGTSGSRYLIYLNGELADTNTASTTRYVSESIAIGRRFWSNEQPHFNGILDDVRFYNRALSEEEIKLLYESYRPQTTVSSVNAGLVGHWSLTEKWTKSDTPGSEIITDRTPYSNDGQNSGATITNEGAEFGGSSDYVEMGKPLIPGNDDFSFSTWVSIPSSPGTHGAIWAQDDSGMFYGYTTFGTAEGNIRFNGIGSTEILVGSDIRGTGWRHVVLLRDGTDFLLYVDGEIDATGSHSGTVNQGDFQIGQETGSSTLRDFNGKISNVRIYNRALSEQEIKLLYDMGR